MRPLLALTLMAGLASLAGTAACSDDNNNNPPAADISITSGASTKTTTAFSPNPFTRSLASDPTVVWVNNDGTVHDIEEDGAALWDSGDMSPNETFSFTFTTPGTYTYHCSIHPGMVGTIVINP
jgi:plastocyanin